MLSRLPWLQSRLTPTTVSGGLCVPGSPAQCTSLLNPPRARFSHKSVGDVIKRATYQVRLSSFKCDLMR